MIIEAYLTAFHRDDDEPVKIRPITIPADRLERYDPDDYNDSTEAMLLDLAYHFGQNDFQPVAGCYSLSVGDVVKLPDGSLHRVAPCGFNRLEDGVDPTALTGRSASEVFYA